jgi:transcription initiation factor TFIIB
LWIVPLFKQADEDKLQRLKSQESILAACIYIACREQTSRSFKKEICALTSVPKKDIEGVLI